MAKDHREELEAARDHLAALLRKREEIEVSIARQKRKVAAWAELCDESEFSDKLLDLDLGGLTDVCRTAMRASRREWMTANEIMNAIRELGFPLNEYKAPMATVTTTVNRLVESGEAEDKRPNLGLIQYKWVGRGVPLSSLLRVGQEFKPQYNPPDPLGKRGKK